MGSAFPPQLCCSPALLAPSPPRPLPPPSLRRRRRSSSRPLRSRPHRTKATAPPIRSPARASIHRSRICLLRCRPSRPNSSPISTRANCLMSSVFRPASRPATVISPRATPATTPFAASGPVRIRCATVLRDRPSSTPSTWPGSRWLRDRPRSSTASWPRAAW